jgi:cbb3-type cytochrome oxidase cytochrome c subunit
MKNGFAVFVAVLVALGASWLGFVVAPAIQLGRAKQTTVLNSTDTWPLQRTGDATLGLQVYRANGCVACHTEQVQQSGVSRDVVITSIGTNRAAYSHAIEEIGDLIYKNNSKDKNLDKSWSGSVWPGYHPPLPIFDNLTESIAGSASDKIIAAGGKAEIHINATGADISRGWGIRRSVAADYLYDYPVQLGSLRAGPDLSNIGARDPDTNWQLVHLYAPQALVKGSAMPPFRFLFEVRKINPGDVPSPDALKFPKDFAPPAGCEVVPKTEAKQLAAYLLSLRQDAPLYEAPFTKP